EAFPIPPPGRFPPAASKAGSLDIENPASNPTPRPRSQLRCCLAHQLAAVAAQLHFAPATCVATSTAHYRAARGYPIRHPHSTETPDAPNTAPAPKPESPYPPPAQ